MGCAIGIVILAFAIFFVWVLLIRPLLTTLLAPLPQLRDLLTCVLVFTGAYWMDTHPHLHIYRALAAAGIVAMLQSALLALQEYRLRDTRATTLERRRRPRTTLPR